MLELIERIRERLSQGAYTNEAAISHGIVTPVLNALGWGSADPTQLAPEYPVDHGRVDFALLGLGRRAAVFIEVKGVDRGREGVSDQQLFTYAFHHGVPLCVLPDGREWRFYLPSGQGSYNDRLIYLLQLDERPQAESVAALTRYLPYPRVRAGTAFDDAQRDHRDATRSREARLALPRAWDALISPPEDALVGLLTERTEALCGFKPDAGDVLQILRAMRPALERSLPEPQRISGHSAATADKVSEANSIKFSMFGQVHETATAAEALVIVLRGLADRNPGKVEVLAKALRTPTRAQIARTAREINPDHPHKARAVEFAPGWLVNLTLSNQSKMRIVRIAAETFDVRMPDDLDLSLPNAKLTKAARDFVDEQ